MTVTAVAVSAQTKKVSILGDSYSTFQGVIPAHYAPFYPNDKNDCTKVNGMKSICEQLLEAGL